MKYSLKRKLKQHCLENYRHDDYIFDLCDNSDCECSFYGHYGLECVFEKADNKVLYPKDWEIEELSQPQVYISNEPITLEIPESATSEEVQVILDKAVDEKRANLATTLGIEENKRRIAYVESIIHNYLMSEYRDWYYIINNKEKFSVDHYGINKVIFKVDNQPRIEINHKIGSSTYQFRGDNYE